MIRKYKALDGFTNSLQEPWKCIGNGKENMLADVRVKRNKT